MCVFYQYTIFNHLFQGGFLMGIIQSGILSPVSGKVAGVVGGKWKDKAYLRAWVKPANPNSAAR